VDVVLWLPSSSGCPIFAFRLRAMWLWACLCQHVSLGDSVDIAWLYCVRVVCAADSVADWLFFSTGLPSLG